MGKKKDEQEDLAFVIQSEVDRLVSTGTHQVNVDKSADRIIDQLNIKKG